MSFVNDRRGQTSVGGLVVGAIVGLIMLIVWFGVYTAANTAQMDSTTVLLLTFMGTMIALVVFVSVVRFLQ